MTARQEEVVPPRDYQQLLACARQFGLQVRPMREEEIGGRRQDDMGQVFCPIALFYPPDTIALARPSYTALLHELVHAIDFLLTREPLMLTRLEVPVKEAIAISVEYLVSVAQLGPTRAQPDICYALSQRVTPGILHHHTKRIQTIRNLILDKLAQQGRRAAQARAE